MFGISYREHKTNEYVWQQVNILAGQQELFLSTVNRRKLSWFGHVCRHDTLPKIILQGTVNGNRLRGRPRRVNHRGTTLGNRQVSHCQYCCTSQTTKVYGRPLQRRRLSEYPNDAWSSRILVISLETPVFGFCLLFT